MAKDISHPALYPLDMPERAPRGDAYMSLTPIEKAFVDAYLATMGDNAKAAGLQLNEVVGNAKYEPLLSDRGRTLLARGRVQAAIAERSAQICNTLDIKSHTVVKEVANIAFSNMGHYVHLDDDGLPYFDFRSCTSEQFAAIQSIQIEELEPSREESAKAALKGEQPKMRRKIKLTLHNKNDALEKLMKYKQLYAPERHEVVVKSMNVNVDMTPEQLAEIYSERLKNG